MRKFQVAYFAVSCDSVETHKKFAASLQLDYPILSDPDRRAAQAYGVTSNAKGLPRRWTFFIGADGKILYIDKKVSPHSHGADCAAKLAELGVAGIQP